MEQLEKLLHTIDTLLGPNGCPWDKSQTLDSMRSSILEEGCELIEAIDLKQNSLISEELGDLIFIALFLLRLAQKEGVCPLDEAVKAINEKLIRRHPHIFGDAAELNTPDEVLDQWQRIKESEKKPKSALDRIPKGLPALARADEFLSAMKKKKYPYPHKEYEPISEEELGYRLFSLVEQAHMSKVEAEQALRKFMAKEEQKFRNWERDLSVSNNAT